MKEGNDELDGAALFEKEFNVGWEIEGLQVAGLAEQLFYMRG
jgi:hypothetical protein